MVLPQDVPPIKSVRKIKSPTSADLTSPFHLPSALNADRPPERRGLARDRVRLLVLDRYTGNVAHTRFDGIAEFKEPRSSQSRSTDSCTQRRVAHHSGELSVSHPMTVTRLQKSGASWLESAL